jgi:hypothetical protein
MSKEEVLKDLEDKKIKNNTQVFISYSPQGPRATTEL